MPLLQYSSLEEEEKRFGIFRDHLADIDIQNEKSRASGASSVFGINPFADITREEFAKSHFGFKKPNADADENAFKPPK